MMRILWICGLPKKIKDEFLGSSHPGSFAAWSWVLAHFPPPPGVELHVACLWAGRNERKDFVYQGVHFHLVPAPARGRALLLFARDASYFRPLYRELRPDVVHGWGTEDSFGLVARQLAPRSHVIGIQGLIKEYRRHTSLGARSWITEVTERLTLRKAENVVAESEYSARISRPLCPNARMEIVEHPLRREFLDAVPSRGTERRALFVGGIEERKGITDALRALASADSGKQWSLHVVGKGSRVNEQAMKFLAEGLGISLLHEGDVSANRLVEIMQMSSLFLLPTRIDTGPTALKEALTMGLWPVCYDNSGPGEYIRKFRFGTLCRDRELDDLIQKLTADLASQPWKDEERRSTLARETRETFSPRTAWSRLISIYERINSSARI